MTPQFERAQRIRTMGISKILLLAQKSREMRAKGLPVIDLSVGQPDFQTPENIRIAATTAMNSGETKYTALDGTPALKSAIQEKFHRDNGLTFEPTEIMATAGAKQVLFNAMMASIDLGDEVILPTPCWLSYFDIVRIAGGTPVSVQSNLESAYKITPAQLLDAISDKSRWLFLNSPSNPSGAVYNAKELGALLDVVAAHPLLMVIAEDVYEHIRFEGDNFATPLGVRPDMRDQILTVNAVSKAFAMTGWRLGYCAGPPDLISAMSIVQSQSTTNPSSISQAAAVEALTGPQDFLTQSRTKYHVRRDLLVSGLSKIDGIECAPPEGAFFVFARVTKLLGATAPGGTKIENDSSLAAYLLDRANVVTVPGSEFGLAGHLRLSFAVSDTDLSTAISSLSDAFSDLKFG